MKTKTEELKLKLQKASFKLKGVNFEIVHNLGDFGKPLRPFVDSYLIFLETLEKEPNDIELCELVKQYMNEEELIFLTQKQFDDIVEEEGLNFTKKTVSEEEEMNGMGKENLENLEKLKAKL